MTRTHPLRQTAALLFDAYRELSARRLFWISLAVSLLVVAFFAMFDINERGLLIFGYQTPLTFFNTSFISKPLFYKLLFYTFGFGIWLSWASMALALISTSHVFPDLVSSGSIELCLSKPIGRVRLFLTKYVLALLFVAIQVTVFSIAAFLVIGVRGGEWEYRLFYGVPLIVLIFSYLYSVCVLVGVLTRSSMTALLVTGGVWLIAFIVHVIETQALLTNRLYYEQAVVMHTEGLAARREDLLRLSAPPPDGAAPDPALGEQRRLAAERVQEWQEALVDAQDNQQTLTTAWRITFALKAFMPKTNETLDMLQYVLFEPGELDAIAERAPRERSTRQIGKTRVPAALVFRAQRRELAERDTWWVLGTSIAFEVAILAIAAWTFSRRDF